MVGYIEPIYVTGRDWKKEAHEFVFRSRSGGYYLVDIDWT